MKTQSKKTKNDKSQEKWSADVTENSDALDLEQNIFESKSAKKIAESLKKSAEQSDRRKSSPYRSAMSMLTFYINRAGKNLESDQKNVLENTKDELRKIFGRAPKH
jgi:putative cell wall-binding protein